MAPRTATFVPLQVTKELPQGLRQPPFDKIYEIATWPPDESSTPAVGVPSPAPAHESRPGARADIHRPFIKFPAAVSRKQSDLTLLRVSNGLPDFLREELLTDWLDGVERWLWLAGLPQHHTRALHRQKLIGRQILVTEKITEHLVWVKDRIFIKPLPTYLLSHDFWTQHLCAATPRSVPLYNAACGLLLSYVRLVGHESDWRIATELHLLPRGVTWAQWTGFVGSVLGHIDVRAVDDISTRYHYGELRLSRLDLICRVQSAGRGNVRGVLRGYMTGSTWQQAYFKSKFAWLLVVFVYLSTVLEAMQVAFSTPQLAGNASFQAASYGTAVAAMVGALTTVIVIVGLWVFLFFFHVLTTYHYTRKAEYERKERVNTIKQKGSQMV